MYPCCWRKSINQSRRDGIRQRPRTRHPRDMLRWPSPKSKSRRARSACSARRHKRRPNHFGTQSVPYHHFDVRCSPSRPADGTYRPNCEAVPHPSLGSRSAPPGRPTLGTFGSSVKARPHKARLGDRRDSRRISCVVVASRSLAGPTILQVPARSSRARE